MEQDKCKLTWHTYQDHLREMMQEMMTSHEFADVTLVSDDKKTVMAHRNILSACSPVFKNIFQMDPKNSHQVIYLRGIQHFEIESILQFIYLGEARFYEDRMNEFLLVAKNLEIQELCENVEQQPADQISNEKQNYIKEEPKDPAEETYHLQEQMKMEEIDSAGSKFKCLQCDQLFSRKHNVKQHIKEVHEDMKFSCIQCDYKARSKGLLNKHVASHHEGVKEQNTRHINSAQENVQFSCNQCGYQAAQQINLLAHIKSVHEGKKFICNNCGYPFKNQLSLNKHIEHKICQ